MVLFIFTLAIFLIVLFYLAIALSLIIGRRSKCEEYEYALRKSFERRYNFSMGVMVYLDEGTSDRIRSLIKYVRGGLPLMEEYAINKEFGTLLSSLDLSASDALELRMLSQDISGRVTDFNKETERFNSSVFSIFLRPVSKMCHVRRIDRL